MTRSDRVPVHVVVAGTDRLSTLVAPLAHSLARGLSASGSNRVRFAPMDGDSTDAFVHEVSSGSEVAELLLKLPGVLILTGHGHTDEDFEDIDGGDNSWRLSTKSEPVWINQIASKIPSGGIRADVLIIDACFAASARGIWRDRLQSEGMLLTASGKIGIQATSQVISGLMSAIANRPGRESPSRSDWEAAYSATQEALRIYAARGGATPVKHQPPCSSYVLN